MPVDPVARLESWLAEAREREDPAGNAMTLATAAADGTPSARVVLLKEIEDGCVVFGGTLDSRKGSELRARPEVSCVLFWPSLGRQVVVEGSAAVAEDTVSDRVWGTRGRDGRLVDLVSEQGAELPDPDALRGALEDADERYGDELARPRGWHAVRVEPWAIEFWEAAERNLAVRERFVRTGAEWRMTRLRP